MQELFPFNSNSSYTNTPQCYFYTYVASLVSSLSFVMAVEPGLMHAWFSTTAAEMNAV
jgi:hypothetical protein